MTKLDPEVDKNFLYGRWEDYSGQRAKLDLRRRKWQDQLGKQVTHKALDEPELSDDDMRIDVRNQGLSGKDLVKLGTLALGFFGVAGIGGTLIVDRLLDKYVTEPQQPIQQVVPADDHEHPVHDHPQFVPGLRWGPERGELQQ